MPISRCSPLCAVFLCAAAPVLLAGSAASAQTAPAPSGPADAAALLPEAPSSVVFSSSVPADTEDAAGAFDPRPTAVKQPVAKRYQTVILPGQTAPHLSVTDKVISSGISSVSPAAVGGWIISAAYEQATNGTPNYPQTGKGFAQRLGAASARSTSETVFGNGVIAAITHEDPRYYKLGSGHNFIARVFYAGTRPILTRTDGGRQTLNLWDLGGDLSGSALTPVYYPSINRSFNEVLKTFGGSVGGDALGFLVSEFFGNLVHIGGSHSSN